MSLAEMPGFIFPVLGHIFPAVGHLYGVFYIILHRRSNEMGCMK